MSPVRIDYKDGTTLIINEGKTEIIKVHGANLKVIGTGRTAKIVNTGVKFDKWDTTKIGDGATLTSFETDQHHERRRAAKEWGNVSDLVLTEL